MNTPKYLKDYVLIAEIEGAMLLLSIDDEPSTYQEAKRYDRWIKACKEEIESINKNKHGPWSVSRMESRLLVLNGSLR